jgi:hypothetical protein
MFSPRSVPPREVLAPPSTDPATPNRIISVLLRPSERVRWMWTEVGMGRAFVSGFQIIQPWRARAASSRRRGSTPAS